MTHAIAALFPVFLLIVIGAILRRTGFPGDAFWPMAERLTYYVFFPALIVRSLAATDLGGFDPLPMAGAMMTGIFAVSAGLVLARRWMPCDGPGFSSVFQGAIRFNAFVGLGAVGTLYGQAGITLFAIAIGMAMPILNILSVAALARYAQAAGAPDWRRQFVLMRQNPLILACIAGGFLALTGIGLPWGTGPVLDLLGRAALPIGLLAVGAGLDIRSLQSDWRAVVISCAVKLVALPLAIALACSLLGVDGLPRTIAILWGALPTASSAYILARQMGGDARLVAAIISVSMIGAALTLPPILAWLN